MTSTIVQFATDPIASWTEPRRKPTARAPGEAGSLSVVDISEFYSDRGGGIRSHLTVRGELLAAQGHRHTVIASGPRDEDTTVRAGGPGRSRLVRLAGPTMPYDHTYFVLHRLGTIRERVRAEAPDVLEAHSPYLAAAAIAYCGRAAARLRTAFWHSDHIGTYVEPALSRHMGERAARAASAPLRQGIRALLAPFDATFAAGREQAARLVAAGVRNVIHAPFGVDTRVFRPAAFSADVRRRLSGDAGEGALLLVGSGRFAAEKRWDVVLDALERVRAQRRAVLVLFGDGPERAALERRAPPGVFFAGFERDRACLAAALASADALVHASPTETFGLGIAEAVACGTPIVVPDAGAAAERAEGACAETYRSLDAESCAAAIERLFRQPVATVRATAYAAAFNARTVDQHCRDVTTAYRELLRELGR